MIVIRKEKDSIFDEIGISPMRIGSIHVKQGAGSREQGAETKAELVTLTHYGTQDVGSEEESDEKDYSAILLGTALHYTLEMMGSFDLHGLDNALISRTHAQIRARHGRFMLFDLGSKSGTLVHGIAIKQHILRPGDVITIADVQLVYGEEISSTADETIGFTPLPPHKIDP